MQLKSGTKIILPLLVVILIFSFLATRSNQAGIVSNPENQQKNPTPENIKLPDETDDTTNNQPVSFENLILYNLINSYRDEHDLNKLFINKLLEDSAQRKLTDMTSDEYFRHSDTNNNESWYLFQAAGYQYKFAGENLSLGNNTPWQVFEAWQKSSAHNEQLLKTEYLDMGLAVNCTEYKIERKPVCLVVLHLGTR